MQKTISFIKRYPYACLLTVQLLSVVFYGFMSDTALSRLIFSCFGLVVPLLALLVVARSPAITWVAILLAVPSILFTLAAGFAGYHQLLLWAHGLESILYFYSAVALIMYMYSDDVVTCCGCNLYAIGLGLCAGLFCLPASLPAKPVCFNWGEWAAYMDGIAIYEFFYSIRHWHGRCHAHI